MEKIKLNFNRITRSHFISFKLQLFMKTIKTLLFGTILLFIVGCKNGNVSEVYSPDNKLKAEIRQDSLQRVIYSVYFNKKEVIQNSLLGISLSSNNQDFTDKLTLIKETDRIIDDSYEVVSGKRKYCSYTANEKTLTFENESNEKMDIIFQTSNHGVAFRYQLYNSEEAKVESEISEFSLPSQSLSWIQGIKSQINDYEYFYTKRLLDSMKLPGYYIPGLFRTPENKWLFISDAAVDGNYAACQLTHKGNGKLAIKIPDQKFEWEDWMETYWHKVVYAETPDIDVPKNLLTPWRAIIISEDLSDIVESNLIENLSLPSQIEDESWIKPGIAVFPWWGESEANDDPEVLKDYIDLAAEMNWEYIEFDIGLLGNNGGYAAEFWRDITYIPEIIEYATSKGIKVYGWDERRNLDTPEKRDNIFGIYRDLGVAGIKMDFINSDKQEAMKWYEEATAHAAKYKLVVSFHGSITPRGLRRTLPNIMAYEGVRGAEYYKFAPDEGVPNPIHNCTLPFTRNVSGPMDYTPVCFSTLRRASTYAHELALPFIYESGWVCMADTPSEFRNSPAKELLQNLHATWDDIHFIDGLPGEYCCLARRKGKDWYIAAINAGEAKAIEIQFDFLKPGSYKTKIYTDNKNDMLAITDMEIESSKPIKLDIAENGGFVLVVKDSSK